MGNLFIMGGGPYNNPFNTYTYTKCLPFPEEYLFWIYDIFGDGMCCERGNGGYSIYIDGNFLVGGGDFASSEGWIITVSASKKKKTRGEAIVSIEKAKPDGKKKKKKKKNKNKKTKGGRKRKNANRD